MTAPSAAALADLTDAAGKRWLEAWVEGPSGDRGLRLGEGEAAPDLSLLDETGANRELSEFWRAGPALIMFWRHFGCGCGIDRAQRLRSEFTQYLDAGLHVVIVAQGEPLRTAVYKDEQQLPCPVLCDPRGEAYRAYGLGHWPVERVLFDAPPEYWSHPRDLGVALQDARRESGRPMVDDPWRAVSEFVVAMDGRVRLAHIYQHCEDFPDPRVLTTAARLSGTPAALP